MIFIAILFALTLQGKIFFKQLTIIWGLIILHFK